MSVLGFEEFSKRLIETQDLDPVYVGAYSALPEHVLHGEAGARWLMSYMLFYNVGFSSWVADTVEDDREFWPTIMQAALNDTPSPLGGRWPRASERRHFRGWQAVRATSLLAKRGSPKSILAGLKSEGWMTAPYLRQCVERDLDSFGEWASFKIADLLERVWGWPIKFTTFDAMYETPEAGVELFIKENFPTRTEATRNMKIQRAWECWKASVGHMTAPPRHERPVGPQEFETCLCKWKSHKKGSYHIGKDIREVMEAAHEWSGVSRTADEFHSVMIELENRL